MEVAVAEKHRRSPHRQTIENELAKYDRFISAQDLHAALARSGKRIGLATVYRNLNDFVEHDIADAISPTGVGQLFRKCSQDDHHHHLTCRNCGRTVEIEPPIESWVTRTARQNGFTNIEHTVELIGHCAECSREELTRERQELTQESEPG